MSRKGLSSPPARPRIAGAGLVALDVVLGEGAHEAATFAGGTCGNVLAILSYLGWAASPIGQLGADVAGRKVMSDLRRWGVDSSLLVERSYLRTPVYIQHLRSDTTGERLHTFSERCPSCGQSLSRLVEPKTPITTFSRQDPPAVFFMDRLSHDILALAQSAAESGALVVYEPSAASDQQYWPDAFQILDVVKYSADRFDSDLVEELHPRIGDKHLWEIQTLGADGLRYRQWAGSNSEWSTLPAIPAPRVLDTCGAGDWCTAGFLFSIVPHPGKRPAPDRPSMHAALRVGQAFASWACAFSGARGAMYWHGHEQAKMAVAALLRGEDVEVRRYGMLPYPEARLTDSVCFDAGCEPNT